VVPLPASKGDVTITTRCAAQLQRHQQNPKFPESAAGDALVDLDRRAAVDALVPAQRDQALDDRPQLGVTPVVPEDGGRARVCQNVGVPRLHPLGREAPVPLR